MTQLTIKQQKELSNILEKFGIYEIRDVHAHGDGHIHSTYLVTTAYSKYIMQKVNTVAFRDVDALMQNIELVTAHLKKKFTQVGKDPLRHTLTVHRALNGSPYYREYNHVYRVYLFIEGESRNQANPADMEAAGAAFGEFQNMLADFPSSCLDETIPHFHDTPRRMENLEKSIEADVMGRRAECEDLIEFARAHVKLAHSVTDEIEKGLVPLRVTHNDTKLNNLLFDPATNEAFCVLDLDTVMPGSLLYDFGDALRFGMATAPEDERDEAKIGISLDNYRGFTRGFVSQAAAALTEKEKELLPLSPILLTFECGIRFLTDYLDGDKYFHIACPDHNLARARNQLTLVRRMEEAYATMKQITEEVLNENSGR